jgi:hypothetical protein
VIAPAVHEAREKGDTYESMDRLSQVHPRYCTFIATRKRSSGVIR